MGIDQPGPEAEIHNFTAEVGPSLEESELQSSIAGLRLQLLQYMNTDQRHFIEKWFDKHLRQKHTHEYSRYASPHFLMGSSVRDPRGNKAFEFDRLDFEGEDSVLGFLQSLVGDDANSKANRRELLSKYDEAEAAAAAYSKSLIEMTERELPTLNSPKGKKK